MSADIPVEIAGAAFRLFMEPWHNAGEIIAVGVAAGADFLIGLTVEMAGTVTLIQLPFDYTVLIWPVR